MSTFMTLHMDDDPDLTLKAPFIPMNTCDDLPILMSQDSMWNTNDRHRSSSGNNSSLAQLLCSSVNKQTKGIDEGGGIILDDIYLEKGVYENETRLYIIF